MAERLTDRFRATDTVARVGGDEFAVLLDETGTVGDAEHLAGEIVELFDEPFTVAGRRLRVGASVGIAPMVRGATTPASVEELVADADLAMYAAKQAGKGRWRAFRPSMRSRAAASLDIREQLEHGFRTDAVEVHYQPVVDTATGQAVGLEALARWRHPTLGAAPPRRLPGRGRGDGPRRGAGLVRAGARRPRPRAWQTEAPPAARPAAVGQHHRGRDRPGAGGAHRRLPGLTRR